MRLEVSRGLAVKSNHLSMERLLIQTIEVRGLAKLKVQFSRLAKIKV